EMVFDAHDRAFALFKGTCTRGIYDNMKTAVETIFVGNPVGRSKSPGYGHLKLPHLMIAVSAAEQQ
ncbi:hypothetical protein, partial [Bradyrhizobium sp. Mp27]|uniref:hypothetical protein n=1 Tax=Bradyrhizobium sp. Mp27 TaxID=3042157 RepID=UPI00248C935E